MRRATKKGKGMDNKIFDKVEIFNSVNGLVSALKTRKFSESAKKNAPYIIDGEGKYNTILAHGDKDLASKIKSERKKIEVNGNGTKKSVEVVRDMCGVAPNIGAFVSGDPRNMINTQIKSVKNTKVINILYINIRPSTISKDVILQASSKFLNTIENMERNGYRINLYAGFGIESSKGQRRIYAIKIKDSGKSLDLLRCAFPLASPDFTDVMLELISKDGDFEIQKRTPLFGYTMRACNVKNAIKNKLRNYAVIQTTDLYKLEDDEQIDDKIKQSITM